MTWLTKGELFQLSLKGPHIGKNVLIDSTVQINATKLFIDDYFRIDAFTILSGQIKIGKFTHISPYVLLGGTHNITIGDCVTISPYGYLFTNSADFYNKSISSPLIPEKYKTKQDSGPIKVGSFTICGAGSKIFPNSEIGEGCKFGVNSVIKGYYASWILYVSQANKIAKFKKSLPRENIQDAWKKIMKDFYNL